jgi:hypothetical protein
MEIPAAGPAPQDGDFLQKFIEKDIVLPEIPSIVFELNEVISNPQSSADQMAQVINKSPSLTALLLKIVNSSFYGLPSKVDRVSLAVTMIGTRELSALALGISIMSIFRKIPSRLLSSPFPAAQPCVRHRIAAAGRPEYAADGADVHRGLLHDLSRLVTFIYFPDEALAVMARCHKSLSHAAEKTCSAATMATSANTFEPVAAALILENNVCFHHDPWCPTRPPSRARSGPVVNALGVGTSGERFVPPLDPKAWEAAGLSAGCLEVVITQAVNQFNTLEFLLQA